jgi:hypothetical protein
MECIKKTEKKLLNAGEEEEKQPRNNVDVDSRILKEIDINLTKNETRPPKLSWKQKYKSCNKENVPPSNQKKSPGRSKQVSCLLVPDNAKRIALQGGGKIVIQSKPAENMSAEKENQTTTSTKRDLCLKGLEGRIALTTRSSEHMVQRPLAKKLIVSYKF